MGLGSSVMAALIGKPLKLPSDIVARFPELSRVSYRRGGLPLRVAGWPLGQSSAAAITLWETVFIARDTPITAALLLHEFCHVNQFLRSRTFPVSYLWQSLRYGYHRNAYEVDANRYAAARLAQSAVDKDL
ncbi:MAG TPA: hypothetical protein VM166_06410 [Gemmatimonadaceae bacterium]|nr:hypothetical protein [Gemmatimonadaceae bacterium]